jgi:hypothetical protein
MDVYGICGLKATLEKGSTLVMDNEDHQEDNV